MHLGVFIVVAVVACVSIVLSSENVQCEKMFLETIIWCSQRTNDCLSFPASSLAAKIATRSGKHSFMLVLFFRWRLSTTVVAQRF